MPKNTRKPQIRHVGGARIALGARFITNGTQYARPVSPLSTSVGRMSLRPSAAGLWARERSRVGPNFRHFHFRVSHANPTAHAGAHRGRVAGRSGPKI